MTTHDRTSQERDLETDTLPICEDAFVLYAWVACEQAGVLVAQSFGRYGRLRRRDRKRIEAKVRTHLLRGEYIPHLKVRIYFRKHMSMNNTLLDASTCLSGDYTAVLLAQNSQDPESFMLRVSLPCAT